MKETQDKLKEYIKASVELINDDFVAVSVDRSQIIEVAKMLIEIDKIKGKIK